MIRCFVVPTIEGPDAVEWLEEWHDTDPAPPPSGMDEEEGIAEALAFIREAERKRGALPTIKVHKGVCK